MPKSELPNGKFPNYKMSEKKSNPLELEVSVSDVTSEGDI
jgi:hypothetical protein